MTTRTLVLAAALLVPRAAASDTSEALSLLSSRLSGRPTENLHIACAEPREGPWCWATFFVGERERFEAVMCRGRFYPWRLPTNCFSFGLWAP